MPDEERWFVLIPATLVIGFVWLQLDPRPPTNDNPEALYLLSAIAQSLAAVLALVFTITLIVGQLSSRYSHRLLGGFFNKWTMGYIGLFISAVLLPIWLLGNPKPSEYISYPFSVKLTITLAVLSLTFLIPYFRSFKYKLDQEQILESLKQKTLKKLRLNIAQQELSELHDEVVTIDNTVMSSFVQKDYDTFSKGVETLSEIAIKMFENDQAHVGRLTLERIKDAGIVSLDDPRVPFIVLAKLNEVALETASMTTINGVQSSTRFVEDIGVRSIDHDLVPIGMRAIEVLNQIGLRLYELDFEDALREESNYTAIHGVMQAVGNMSIRASKKDLEAIVRLGAMKLGSLSKQAVEKGNEHAVLLGTGALADVGENVTAMGKEDLGELVVTSLNQIAERAASNGLEGVINRFPDYFKVIGVAACKSELHDITEECVNNLVSLVDEAQEHPQYYEVVPKALTNLVVLGAYTTHVNVQTGAIHQLQAIEDKMGAEIVDLTWQRVRLELHSKLGGVATKLWEPFENRYYDDYVKRQPPPISPE